MVIFSQILLLSIVTYYVKTNISKFYLMENQQHLFAYEITVKPADM